jgi:predicted secreted protein
MFAGCATTVETYPTTHTARISGPESAATTRVAEGETLTVQLPTKPKSVYAWRLAPESTTSNFITLLNRREQRNAKSGVASSGEAANDVFTFAATDSGSVPLVFIYDCAWGGQSKTMMFTLDVEVYNAQAEARARRTEEERMRKEAEALAKAEEAQRKALEVETQAIAAAESDSDVQ